MNAVVCVCEVKQGRGAVDDDVQRGPCQRRVLSSRCETVGADRSERVAVREGGRQIGRGHG